MCRIAGRCESEIWPLHKPTVVVIAMVETLNGDSMKLLLPMPAFTFLWRLTVLI